MRVRGAIGLLYSGLTPSDCLKTGLPAPNAKPAAVLSQRGLILLGLLTVGAILADRLEAPPWLVFILSGLCMLPLGSALARASEDLAEHMGPGPGALLNATFGNAPELVILFVALNKGLLDVVKATLSGSILANLLLVLGLSAVVGGLRYKFLNLHPLGAAANLGTLTLVVAALLFPAVFAALPPPLGADPVSQRIEDLSLGTAATLLLVYALSLIFMFRTHSEQLKDSIKLSVKVELARLRSHAPPRKAIAWIAGCVALVVVLSEQLVDATDSLVDAYHLPPLFMGVVGLALVGNAADYSSAIQMAWNNKLDLAFRVATGAALQVALFVAPVLVIASRFTHNPLNLNFSPLEVLSVALAVVTVTAHSSDNAFTWYEGAQLLALYVIIGLAFFFY